MLSASDIETYRTCPLKYKFARVFRIPQEPTINQRFGIVVHQVLERFHVGGMATVDDMHGLLEAGWRRGGFGDSDEERQLHAKARTALERYCERWPGRGRRAGVVREAFSFKLGPHLLRGRVDRVDRLPGRQHELIDYKTGRPKTPAQLRDDVQLAVYALAAREAWDLEASAQSYHYVLDDEKVPLPPAAVDREWVSRDGVHRRRGHPLARGSSRRRPTRRARCATSASSAPPPSGSVRTVRILTSGLTAVVLLLLTATGASAQGADVEGVVDVRRRRRSRCRTPVRSARCRASGTSRPRAARVRATDPAARRRRSWRSRRCGSSGPRIERARDQMSNGATASTKAGALHGLRTARRCARPTTGSGPASSGAAGPSPWSGSTRPGSTAR